MSIYLSVDEKDLKQIPSHSMVLGEDGERLRWFVWPDEISLIEEEEEEDSKVTTSTCEMLRPELYLKKQDENLCNSEMKGSAVLQSLNKKYPRRTADSTPMLSSGELTLSKPRALKEPVVVVDTSSSSSSSTSSKPATKTTKQGKKVKNSKKIPKKISSAVGRVRIYQNIHTHSNLQYLSLFRCSHTNSHAHSNYYAYLRNARTTGRD
jgi:hypothetical protein